MSAPHSRIVDIRANRRKAWTEDKYRKATGNRRDVIGVEHTRVLLCFEMYCWIDATTVVVWREMREEIYS